MPCANIDMVIQAVSKMEFRKYFDSDDIIEWEDQKLTVVQILFNKNYDLYVKQPQKIMSSLKAPTSSNRKQSGGYNWMQI